MVQREVGERLAAAPGGEAYGASSVLAQLACEVRVLRKVPRTVFHPAPHVDSVLVTMRRRGAGAGRGLARPRARRLRAPAQGARRLARARAGRAAGAPRRGPRRARGDRAARATRAPSGSRPPTGPGSRGRFGDPRARPGEAQPGAARGPARRRAAPDRVAVRLARAGGRGWSLPRPARTAVICPGVEGENLAAVALRELRERVPPGPAAARRADRQAHPDRRRPRRRERRRRRGAPRRQPDRRVAARRRTSCARSPLGSARTCRARWSRATGWSPAPARCSSRSTCPPADLAAGAGRARPDRGGGLRRARSVARAGADQLDPEPLRRLAGAGAETLAAVLENDLEPPARTLLPEIGAALDALRGAGALGRRP